MHSKYVPDLSVTQMYVLSIVRSVIVTAVIHIQLWWSVYYLADWIRGLGYFWYTSLLSVGKLVLLAVVILAVVSYCDKLLMVVFGPHINRIFGDKNANNS